MCIELKKRRESQWCLYWIDGYFDCPYICVGFPRESRRYSRRLPELYVFGSLERVIDSPAGCPSSSPSIYRTAPTDLPVLIRTWVTLSLAVFRALFTEISRSFPEF